MYLAIDQAPWRTSVVVYARPRGDVRAAAAVLRATVARLVPLLPPVTARSLAEAGGSELRPWTLLSRAMGFFGVLALALAAAGLYAVLSFIVSGRTREIGVRRAVGASSASIASLVLSQAGRLTAIGLVIGAGLAVVTATVARAMIVGVLPVDPVSYLLAGSVLVLAAFLASLVPAARAVRVEPTVALRAE